jgi:hypothetical protein
VQPHDRYSDDDRPDHPSVAMSEPTGVGVLALTAELVGIDSVGQRW